MTKEIKELFYKQKKEREDTFNDLINSGKVSITPRASRIETRSAYTNVLETGNKAMDALNKVSQDFNKTSEWVERVKNSPLPKKTINYAIDYHTDHAVTKLMEKENVLNRQGKRALRSSSTLSAFLNTLSHQVKLTREICELKETVDKLIFHAAQTHDRLDVLEDFIKISKKEALLLMKKGYNNTYIQKLSGRHRNTISRWRKEFNKGVKDD